MVDESQARERVAARILVHGRVQGVGYRFFAQGLAASLGLRGWVRNLPDGDVEAYAEGARSTIEAFAQRLEEGPSMGRVEGVRVTWSPPENRYLSFSIIS